MSPTAATAPVMIAVANISPSPHNPRIIDIKSPALAELSRSIKQQGLISPIVVRALDQTNRYELVAGERRWRATKLADLKEIAAVITPLTEKECIAITVTENLQREDLNILEESKGVASLIGAGWDAKDVAEKLGKDLSWVARRNRIDKLHPELKKEWLADKGKYPHWTPRALELFARLEPAVQLAIHKTHENALRQISFEQLEKLIAEHTRFLSLAPWSLDDAALVPKAGSCLQCEKRASCVPGLFDDVTTTPDDKKLPKKDRCLDAICWSSKAAAHIKSHLKELLIKHPDLVAFTSTYTNTATTKADNGLWTISGSHGAKEKNDYANIKLFGVWIDGPLAGTTETLYFDDYHVPAELQGKKKSTSKAEGKPTKKEKPKNITPAIAKTMLADRHEALEARRAALITKDIIDRIKDKYPHRDITEIEATHIISLCVHVGIRGAGRQIGTNSKHTLSIDRIKIAFEAWSNADQFIRQWLTVYTAIDALKHIDNVKLVAKLMRLEWKPLFEATEKALPEPASWKKLEDLAAPKKK